MTVAPAVVTPTPTPVHTPSLRELIGAISVDQSFEYLKGLFYGEPGAGKTFLFGTITDLPDIFLPAILIDIDGGTATIRTKTQIDTKRMYSIDDIKSLYGHIAADPKFYKTIGLDNVSELQKIDMNTVMVEAKETAKNPENIDIYVPGQREWGKSGERMRIIVRSFRNLPCHVFMFAHLDEREDQTTKIVRLWPSLPGKLRHELSGFFDIVGYLSTYEENNQTFRQIQFAKTRRVAAKDRFSALPPLMKENPTIPQIWEYISASGATVPDDSRAALVPPPVQPNALADLQAATATATPVTSDVNTKEEVT